MRRGMLWAGAALAVLAAGACRESASGREAMSADLARDMAAAGASSNDQLALAPVGGRQTVVSAVERVPEGAPAVRRSTRVTRPVAARHAVHRERVTPRVVEPVSEVAATTPAPEPAAPAPEVASTPNPDAGVAVPRPHPVDVSYPSDGQGNGTATGRGSGIGIGDVIGVIGAVVIRGGVVDGDHCDPRAADPRARRRIPSGGISINNRIPVIHGTF